MKTRTPRMTPHCRVIDSGGSFVLNSTSSRPDLSLAPSLVAILRTIEALLPSSSWISSSDHVVNSLKNMVPKHELWNRLIVTGFSLSDLIEVIFFSASGAVGTSLTRNCPGLDGLQDKTRPHLASVERTRIVESSPWKLTTTDRGKETQVSAAVTLPRSWLGCLQPVLLLKSTIDTPTTSTS